MKNFRMCLVAIFVLVSGPVFAQKMINPPPANTGGITVGAAISGTCPNGQVVFSNAGVIGCQAAGGAGTVTNVTWSDGIVSVVNPTTTPTFSIAGTSGGIVYFSASNSWASSAALTNHALVLGGGAGAAPTVVGSLGTTTTLLHGNAAGNPTFSAVALAAEVSGTLAIGNGGTGQTTVSTAFNALSPMTTAGDIIYGGAAGAGTRLAAGTGSQFFTGGTTPAWTTMAGDCTFSVPNITCLNTNGVAFGSLATLSAAPAGTLTGTTLNATVVTSSLTSLGTIGTLTVSGTATAANLTATALVTTVKLDGSGGAPTLSACGTGPAFVGTGTKLVGVVTEGTGATGCTVTWSSAFTNAPRCLVGFIGGIMATTSWTQTTTALTVTNTSAGTFTYHCLGT